MHHVAIMKKEWGLIPKILSGEKAIESRWYMARYAPWDRISAGDSVFFKNSGEPVTVKATVAKVEQYEQLDSKEVKRLLYRYGEKDGLGIDDLPKFYEMFKNKKYAIFVFLTNPQKVEPFEIDKTGFGAMAAWLTMEDVGAIRAVGKIGKTASKYIV